MTLEELFVELKNLLRIETALKIEFVRHEKVFRTENDIPSFMTEIILLFYDDLA